MDRLIELARHIDRLTARLGRSVSWLIVAAAVVSAGYAVVRKALNMSSNAWLEAQWWLFAVAFLLAAPWTLAQNEHIRIDILNNHFTRWQKSWVEIIGHVFFLLPTAVLLLYTSSHYFLTSYAQNEQSTNPGGLPQWPIKAMIPLAFALLLAQGISELIKRIAIMQGRLPEPRASGTHHPAIDELEAHNR